MYTYMQSNISNKIHSIEWQMVSIDKKKTSINQIVSAENYIFIHKTCKQNVPIHIFKQRNKRKQEQSRKQNTTKQRQANTAAVIL